MSSSSRATTSESRTVDDKFVTHNLDKPTPTVEWLPDGEELEGKLTIQKLIVGTCAPENEQSILMLDQVKLSREDWVGEESSSSVEIGMTRRVQKINHDGVVNWARYMPQNPSIIATKTGSAEFFIFDCTKHPSKPPEEGVCNPDLRLTGHKDKGHCLSWSPFKKGHLLSGSEDGQVCLWDVNATPTDKTLEAMRIFDIQHGCIEDVAWHMKDGNLFGTVGEDKHLHIWDIRTPAINFNQSVLCHDAKVNSLAFCGPIVATGSSDRKVKVFDPRKTSPFLHTLECHREEVGHGRWNHKHENYLASSSGRKIIVWDISRMGHAQTSEEANRGPLEFVFFHSAHTDSITDFSWSPTYDLAIASVAKDNNLEVLRMRELIFVVKLQKTYTLYLSSTSNTRRVQKINHDGVVNWARYMPQNPSIIATKTGSAEFFIFDCTKHPSKHPEEGVCNPDLRLTGHKDKGHCLSWSPFKKGHLLSGSEDGQVCLWDVNATPTDKTLEAMRIFDIQHGCIEDVAWHMKDGNLFGTVGEDKHLHIWDIRTPAINFNQSVLCHDAKLSICSYIPLEPMEFMEGVENNDTIEVGGLRACFWDMEGGELHYLTEEWDTFELELDSISFELVE
ncbi:PREDICTED: WD-40 repeat-containing protein MSI1-like [Ipomoea nil]|uniref:WD-40 repeat-containing protein MSI1-like n=1 Tax=Ipomoea nil TaxID=35883 RepID=UPI00090185D2|nr:PREDICTED: WD-40 repeat-containing protein MSI1-like [Ipomoea nil]